MRQGTVPCLLFGREKVEKQRIEELRTPAMLVDLDVLEANIRKYAEAARVCGKALWPMVKTHKSLEIARMQAEAGCDGFILCSDSVKFCWT